MIMEEIVSKKQVEEWLIKAGMNSYPSKVHLLYTLCNNSNNYSIASIAIINEKALTLLDVRETILAEDRYFKI